MIRFSFLCGILLASILILQFVNAGDDEEEEETCPCIVFSVTQDAVPCSDFDNVDYILNLKLDVQKGKEDEPDMMEMNGNFDLKKECTEDLEIELAADLETSNGPEKAFFCASSFGASLKDKDAPWYSIFKYFNVTSCPVPADYYAIEGLVLDLSWASGALTSDFIGTYTLKLIFKKALDVLFCIALGAEIYEVNIPCSECPTAN